MDERKYRLLQEKKNRNEYLFSEFFFELGLNNFQKMLLVLV